MEHYDHTRERTSIERNYESHILKKMTVIGELAKKYKYFLIACDGVLWQGQNQIGEAFRNIEKLEEQGAQVFFVTNSAGINRETMAQKIMHETFGYKSLRPEQVYPVSSLTALQVK